MRRDGLIRLSGTSPGGSFLLSVVVAWLSACPAPARGQQPSPPAPAPAPLPKNLTPNELPNPVAVPQVPQPLASALPSLDASCEPVFQSGLAEDCGYCLELWQGYCQERRHCRHVASTRRGLGFFGLCWPKFMLLGARHPDRTAADLRTGLCILRLRYVLRSPPQRGTAGRAGCGGARRDQSAGSERAPRSCTAASRCAPTAHGLHHGSE